MFSSIVSWERQEIDHEVNYMDSSLISYFLLDFLILQLKIKIKISGNTLEKLAYMSHEQLDEQHEEEWA